MFQCAEKWNAVYAPHLPVDQVHFLRDCVPIHGQRRSGGYRRAADPAAGDMLKRLLGIPLLTQAFPEQGSGFPVVIASAGDESPVAWHFGPDHDSVIVEGV